MKKLTQLIGAVGLGLSSLFPIQSYSQTEKEKLEINQRAGELKGEQLETNKKAYNHSVEINKNNSQFKHGSYYYCEDGKKYHVMWRDNGGGGGKKGFKYEVGTCNQTPKSDLEKVDKTLQGVNDALYITSELINLFSKKKVDHKIEDYDTLNIDYTNSSLDWLNDSENSEWWTEEDSLNWWEEKSNEAEEYFSKFERDADWCKSRHTNKKALEACITNVTKEYDENVEKISKIAAYEFMKSKLGKPMMKGVSALDDLYSNDGEELSKWWFLKQDEAKDYFTKKGWYWNDDSKFEKGKRTLSYLMISNTGLKTVANAGEKIDKKFWFEK